MTEREESPFISLPSGTDIAHYFIEDHCQDFDGQGCEGIALWRDGYAYCYAWMEAHVDHDMEQYFLLDIRTHQGQVRSSDPSEQQWFGETRDYLYVAVGVGMKLECEWHNQPINFAASSEDHQQRCRTGLTWFIDHVLGEHNWVDDDKETNEEL